MIILLLLPILGLLSAVRGLCYSPLIHGFAPDVILPSIISSDISCPLPLVFDHFVCKCVDPSVVPVRVPTQGRTSLQLSFLGSKRLAKQPSFRVPQMTGLPDMQFPGPSAVSTTVRLGTLPGRVSDRVVPVLNPYGSYNMPANSKMLKAAAKARQITNSIASKQQEILEKVRWQEQLQRESVAVVELAAAAASAASVPTAPAVNNRGAIGLDGFMRDTLRRILYGY